MIELLTYEKQTSNWASSLNPSPNLSKNLNQHLLPFLHNHLLSPLLLSLLLYRSSKLLNHLHHLFPRRGLTSRPQIRRSGVLLLLRSLVEQAWLLLLCLLHLVVLHRLLFLLPTLTEDLTMVQKEVRMIIRVAPHPCRYL